MTGADPYLPGHGDVRFQVEHYDLDLQYKVSDNHLEARAALRLRALEEQGIVERHTYPEVPPRVEYQLTDLGVSAARPLALIRTWAEQNLDRIAALNPRWAD